MALRILIPADKLRARIGELGKEIDRDYPNGTLYLICILKGATIFLSDLARSIHRDAFIDFMGIASYGKGKTSSGEVKVTKDLDISLEGADVLIVEDRQLPELRTVIQTDVVAAYEGDPAARSVEEIILAYPCVLVISLQRVAHVLYHLGVPLLPRMLTEYGHERTGADIHPGARI